MDVDEVERRASQAICDLWNSKYAGERVAVVVPDQSTAITLIPRYMLHQRGIKHRIGTDNDPRK